MNKSHPPVAKKVIGALVVIGAIIFIVYGLYLANRPVVAPLQGQIDGRYIDISPKIIGASRSFTSERATKSSLATCS
jgi:hypothetical protein